MSEERTGPEPADDADDLGILDDLLGLEPDADGEDQPPEPQPNGRVEAEEEPPPQPHRGHRRVEALRGRLREQEDENRRLRQDIERMMTQSRAPAPAPVDPYRQAEFDRQEAERLAMMAPHEVAAYSANKVRQEMQQQLMRQDLQTRDMLDRQLYETLKTRDRLAERYADQVEALLAQARQQGMNPGREILLNALVGQEIRQKAQKQAGETRRRAARQVAAQTTQPGNGRSTAATNNRRQTNEDSDDALMQRLRNTTLGDAWRTGTG